MQKAVLVNKLESVVEVLISELEGGVVEVVDNSTQGGMWWTENIIGSTFNIAGYAIAVLTVAGQ